VTTRAAILAYLRTDGEARELYALLKYMQVMHKAGSAAVRTELWRLCQQGKVERVGVGLYRGIAEPDSAGLAQLEQSQPD